MSDLLTTVLEAHGGLQRWQELSRLRVHASIGGAIWTLKGKHGVLGDERIEVDCHKQWVSFVPFAGEKKRGIFEPDRTVIESLSGELIEERHNPRDAFDGHTWRTSWDDLNAVYFSGYAIWGYLTAPFHLVMPGITTEEIEPRDEGGKTLRRLKVSYPSGMAVHSPVQTFYFDRDGLMHRLDYSVDIMVVPPSAHYMTGHKEFGGIIFPTRRRVYGQRSDGTPMLERVAASIDIHDVTVF
jgi:hypothetical protein